MSNVTDVQPHAYKHTYIHACMHTYIYIAKNYLMCSQMVIIPSLTTCREASRSRQRGMKIGTWNVMSLYMDWIGLAQDRDRWRTLVSEVMNLWVP